MRLFWESDRNKIDSVELRVFVIPQEDDGCFGLQTELLFNGSVGIGVPVDLCELKKAINSDGVYFVWTCGCGTPGCAGRSRGIQVHHANEFTTFLDMDDSKRPIFRFESKYLREAFDMALKNGRRLVESFSGASLVSIPDQNREFFKTPSVLDAYYNRADKRPSHEA